VLAAAGPTLLVLDELDRLDEPGCALIGAWLELAPGLQVLVTSRSRIPMLAQRVVPVEPLAPDDGVALLVDRIDRIRPRTVVEPAERAILLEIGRQLDGLPLALELVVPRIAALGANAVLERLGRRLDLLSRGTRTLRDAIEDSWQLLGDLERAALAQCSVFRGAFDLAFAEQVLELGGARAVCESIQTLIERSLLHPADPRDPDAGFTMLHSIRAFAGERLAADPRAETAVWTRYAAASTRRAEQWANDLEVLSCRDSLERFARERETLVAIAARTVRAGSADQTWGLGLRLLVALFQLVRMRGSVPGYTELLDEALRHPQAIPPALQIALRGARARIAARRGRLSEARADLDAALVISRELGDRRAEAALLLELGTSHGLHGWLDEGKAFLAGAIAVSREIGDRRTEADALSDLGQIEHAAGELAAAEPRLVQALAIHVDLDQHARAALDRVALGQCHLLRDERADAAFRLHEAARTFLESGLGALAFLWECPTGTFHHVGDDLEAARTCYLHAATSAEIAGAQVHEAWALALLGSVALEQAQLEAAYASLSRARALYERSGDEGRIAFVIAALGVVHAAAGRLGAARIALDEAAGRARGSNARTAVAVLQLVADLAAAAHERDPGVASERRWDVRERCRALMLPATTRVLEIRIALRVASAALARDAVDHPEVVDREDEDVVIHASGDWVRRRDGTLIDCSNRQAPTRSILLRLAFERLRSPGRAVPPAELVAAGWPGEWIREDAARGRVRTAILTLRKLGLRDVLKSVGDGYLFAPSVRVRIEVPSA
jgi:predicted ATPase